MTETVLCQKGLQSNRRRDKILFTRKIRQIFADQIIKRVRLAPSVVNAMRHHKVLMDAICCAVVGATIITLFKKKLIANVASNGVVMLRAVFVLKTEK